VTPPVLHAEPLRDVGGELLEGPSWEPGRERLLFVDILRSERLTYDWRTAEVTRVPGGDMCSAWIPRRGGGSVVATRDALVLLDHAGAVEGTIGLEADRPENRANDAKCDPRGRLWVGTMALEEKEPTGALYRIDGGAPDRVIAGATIANGLGWSPDERRMYWIDSPTREVAVLEYDADRGEPTDRRVLVDVSAFDGVPDGMSVDAEGCVWVAFYGGGAVRRFSPTGEHLATVSVPAARTTSCAFAGPGLDRLVITTAAAPDGTGGDLFVCDPGVPGLAVPAYEG
jgi:sugar lactone lactonase YvrE